MNTLSSFAALVTAALFAIAAGTAWADEAAQNVSAETVWSTEAESNEPAADVRPDKAAPEESDTPAAQTPAPVTTHVPGRYPPPPAWGGYPQAWQHPSQRPSYYLPQGQYRAAPAAPAVNPLSAELNQAREQLAAKSTELDTARATLEQSRLELQQRLEAERVLNEKVADISSEHQVLQARMTELSTERDRLRDELAGRDRQQATLQAELQATMEVLLQAQSENTLTGQQLDTAMVQADRLRKTLAELKAWLETQKTTLDNVP